MRKSLISLAAALVLAALTLYPAYLPSVAANAAPIVVYEDTSGSTMLFLNSSTPVVRSWYYDASKDRITVSVTLKGSLIGSVVLQPGNNSGTITGTVTGDTAELQVGANFNTHVMASAVSVSGVNGNRNGTNNGSF